MLRDVARAAASDVQARLQAERESLVAQIAHDDAMLSTPPEDRGEDLTASQHPADVASDLSSREALLATDHELRAQVAEIDSALGALRQGRYGVCVDCQRRIPAARLEAQPQAVRCIECQRRSERLR